MTEDEKNILKQHGFELNKTVATLSVEQLYNLLKLVVKYEKSN